mgnify:CR=1 FL=1|jgi:hypothetical protein
MNVLKASIANTYSEIQRMGSQKTKQPKVNSFMAKPMKEKEPEVNDSVRLTLAVREAFGND